MRRALSLALLLALALGVTPALAREQGGGSGEKGKRFGFEIRGLVRFHDEDEAPWAVKHMMKGQMLGVIRGYPDGTFRPQSAVKREEVLAMVVRALGRDPAPVGEAVYRVYDYHAISPWARGYVQAALDLGLIDPGQVLQPHKAASRLWVVEVLVRALGRDAEARSRAGEALPFADAASVPADKAGYVLVAIDLGLVSGYPDQTFRPHQPVKRAEMAALLDAFEGVLSGSGQTVGDQVYGQRYRYTGVVASVYGQTIELALPSGGTRTFTVGAGAWVFVDGRPASLTDLQSGYLAHLFLGPDGKVVFVEARSRPPLARLPVLSARGKVKGILAGVDPNAGTVTVALAGLGRKETYEVAPFVEIGIGGLEYATLEDLAAYTGDPVELKLREGRVVEIEVRARPKGRWWEKLKELKEKKKDHHGDGDEE